MTLLSRVAACFAVVTALASPGLAQTLPYQWHDEMDAASLDAWRLMGSQNDPVKSMFAPGVLTLTLPQAPIGYPHPYQWGAVTQTIAVDTADTPLLVARVSRLSDGGYAHLDVEMRDYDGKVVKGTRSANTLTGAGFLVTNLREQFGTGLLRLTVRLIVGGSNTGVWCDYDYVRAMRPEAYTTLQNAAAKKPVPSAKSRRRK